MIAVDQLVRLSGIACPRCGSSETRVTDSRPVRGAIRRRRACERCEIRFTTHEAMNDLLTVGAMAERLASIVEAAGVMATNLTELRVSLGELQIALTVAIEESKRRS